MPYMENKQNRKNEKVHKGYLLHGYNNLLTACERGFRMFELYIDFSISQKTDVLNGFNSSTGTTGIL